ncbi:MAG: hypothetical protein V1836_01130 [Candidatus Aenigmatarchaeota archaeon]
MKISYYHPDGTYDDSAKADYSPQREAKSALLDKVSTGVSYVSSFLSKSYRNSNLFFRYGRKRRPKIWSSAKNCGYCGSESMNNQTIKLFGVRRILIAHCQNCGAAA